MFAPFPVIRGLWITQRGLGARLEDRECQATGNRCQGTSLQEKRGWGRGKAPKTQRGLTPSEGPHPQFPEI